jgi:hypothetical protein
MSQLADVVSIATSALGSVAIAGALFYSARQTKALQDQLVLDREQAERALVAHRANNDLQLMTHAMALDRLFVELPELRPYFYDGEPIPDGDPERGRVISAAELIVDLADTVASMQRHGQLDPEDEAAWAIAMEWYGRSPAVRLVAAHGAGMWRSATLRLLAIDGEARVHPIAKGIPSHAAVE